MTTENKEIDLKKIVEIVTPFDDDPVGDKFEYEPLLNEIQGNIIKSHGRNHAVYLFLKFNDNIEAAKEWIGNFSHRYVTSALEQAEQGKLYRENKDVPGTIFANFFLTRAGYMHLGYTYEQLPSEDAFRQGMQDPNMQSELGDDSQQWEAGFQNEIHALVLLAADRIVGPRTQEAKRKEQQQKTELLVKVPALLALKVENIKEELQQNLAPASVVHEEEGYVLRNADAEEIEHFGFRDGVSQPLFLKRDIDKEREHSDFSNWDPRAPLNLVLFKDPLGDQNKESYGSFLVFRKLEQNVKGWNNDVVNNLAKKLNVPDELARAYTMGRFQDGTVVVQSSQKDNNYKGNNFNYSEDPQGSKCPFFAHARKVNPRGDTGNPSLVSTPTRLEEEKMHRIARRAINYGPLPSEEPEKDAGLLFMCFQASLTNQFNFMQKAWAKEQNFVKRDVGTDVVIGVEKTDDGGGAIGETYNWPTQWGAAGKTEATFDHWVTMRGGEFFFAPSMSFLKSLAPEPSRNEITQDIDACEYKMAELKEYKALNWAIGLNGDTLEPDGFVKFFDERNLPFEYYVRSQGVSQGDDSAYEKNITTLKNYITQLGDA
jgi:Dyp-type peroxidase family